MVRLLTRIERNRIYRRSKRKFRLFILIIIILTFISMIHINNSYNELIDNTNETNQIFSINKDKDTMGITIFGEQIKLSNNFIIQGRDFFQNIYKHIYYWINGIIVKC